MIAKITFEGENKCVALWLDGDITIKIRAVFQALRAYFLFLKAKKERGDTQAIKSLCGYSLIKAPEIECIGKTAKIKKALLNDWQDKMVVLDYIFFKNIGIYCDKIIKYDFSENCIEINPNIIFTASNKNNEEIYTPFKQEENGMSFFRILKEEINIFKEKYNVTQEKIFEDAHVTRQYLEQCEDKKSLPSKDIVLKLAFALKHNLQKAEILLYSAGHVLSSYINRDNILKKCFEDGIFEIEEVNKRLKEKKEILLKK